MIIGVKLYHYFLMLLGISEVEAEHFGPFQTKCCISPCCSISIMCLHCHSHIRYFMLNKALEHFSYSLFS